MGDNTFKCHQYCQHSLKLKYLHVFNHDVDDDVVGANHEEVFADVDFMHKVVANVDFVHNVFADVDFVHKIVADVDFVH